VNEDPIHPTHAMQTGALIINPVKTDKLLAWHLQIFDPDADTNCDHFYELDSLTSCSKIMEN